MTDNIADQLPLASEFPPASHNDWLRLVAGILKDASFEDALVSRTRDGLRIEPLYQRAKHARVIAPRASAAPWQILQRVDHPDPAAANAQALHELENGATGLSLVFAGAIGAYGYGLPASEAALERMLEGVHFEAGIALELDLSPPAKDAGPIVAGLARSRGVVAAAADIRFGFDPLGAIAHSGTSALPWGEIAPILANLIRDLAAQGFRGPFAVADGRPVHAAGGSEAQELAFVLACALAYLRALESGDIALDDARRMIFFRLAADADQFLTMAKFRALRALWASVEKACGLEPAPVFVSAETAWRMMTRRDPWVNMLRTTIATFAAGVGGANAITVLPFTAALGLPDRFARRIARNTQLILMEESNLAKVLDPVAGSGGIEDITDQLCRAAWSLFQEIEAEGGAFAALEGSLLQAKITEVRAAREAALARGTDALTGTTQFPDLAEAPVSVLDVTPIKLPPLPNPIKLEPLSPIRLAAPFERLRDASDRALMRTGSRPKVFLAGLGRPSDFAARMSFARNFFAAGGVEAAGGESFPDRDALIAALRASGAALACLCSSDAVYAREAAGAARALKAAGVLHVYLAGGPASLEHELRQAGVDTFVHPGGDALATLAEAHDILGVN